MPLFMFHHRYIGGIEHTFESVAVIQALGEPQNVQIAVLRGAHDQLRALSGRSKFGRMETPPFLTRIAQQRNKYNPRISG